VVVVAVVVVGDDDDDDDDDDNDARPAVSKSRFLSDGVCGGIMSTAAGTITEILS